MTNKIINKDGFDVHILLLQVVQEYCPPERGEQLEHCVDVFCELPINRYFPLPTTPKRSRSNSNTGFIELEYRLYYSLAQDDAVFHGTTPVVVR